MASIYIHIPFCERKCIYCDFYSVEDLFSAEMYLDALKNEIEMYADYGIKEEVETIYFGGGTPSLLKSQSIVDILHDLKKTFSIRADAEITIEVNPGTVKEEKLRSYREAGINRISIGVQSFDDGDLKFLTRIHSVEQAIQTIQIARSCGFENLSLDMIYALPSQSLVTWQKNLDRAISFNPEHISAYGLTIEDETPLGRLVKQNEIIPVQLDNEAAMYELTMECLQKRGYEHYEVSNFSKPGFKSKHNCNYWNHSNYLGLGPSAHSFWGNKRWWNHANIAIYCKMLQSDSFPIAGSEVLGNEQLLEEAIMLGLRMGEIDFRRVELRFGGDYYKETEPILQNLVSSRLITLENHVLKLTDKGFLLCDEIAKRLIAKVTP
ncbi:MAG: radical SAM family heme chaperone HemW [Bacteroidota bacterium]|nr:radical SAM family heme chaperone HemW [Bacteroidota bacterium]